MSPGEQPRSSGLTGAEIERAFRLGDHPPILSVKQAARMVGESESAIYRRVARGEFRSAINGRGKPLRFWRDRFVKEYFAPGPRSSAHGPPRTRS